MKNRKKDNKLNLLEKLVENAEDITGYATDTTQAKSKQKNAE